MPRAKKARPATHEASKTFHFISTTPASNRGQKDQELGRLIRSNATAYQWQSSKASQRRKTASSGEEEVSEPGDKTPSSGASSTSSRADQHAEKAAALASSRSQRTCNSSVNNVGTLSLYFDEDFKTPTLHRSPSSMLGHDSLISKDRISNLVDFSALSNLSPKSSPPSLC